MKKIELDKIIFKFENIEKIKSNFKNFMLNYSINLKIKRNQ